jgi:hypothetical protein
MGNCEDLMDDVLRRLLLQMLKAKLALFKVERISLMERIESQATTPEERIAARGRLVELAEEVLAVTAALNKLFSGNGR